MRLLARLLATLGGLIVSAAIARRLAQPGRARARSAPADRALPRAVFAPEAFWQHLPVEPGMRVLLLGPADVVWVHVLAHALGRYGRLYVLEPSSERAHALQHHLRTQGVGGVEVLTAGTTRLELPDSSIDLVLGVAVLAGRPRRQRLLWELQRVLRPGGHLAVAEGLYGPRYLRASTLRHETQAVGLQWRGRHGSPLAYVTRFQKPL